MINLLKRNETITILCMLVTVVMLGMGLISPILPLYGQSFGVSITMVGLLITGFGVARILVDIPAAGLTEKFGRRPILIAGPVIQIIASLGCGLATSFWQLLAFRFLQGVGSATLTTAAMIMLADISISANRGRIMSLYQGSLLLGSGLGPIIGGFVAQYFGLRAPFYAYALVAAVAVLWAYFRIPETRRVTEQKASPTQHNKRGSAIPIARIRNLLRDPNFATICLVSFFLFFMRAGSRNQLLPLLANDRLGLNPGQIGLAFATISIFDIIILFLCGSLSDRYGRKKMITLGCVLSSVTLAMLSQAYSYSFLLLTCVMWGIGAGISGPIPAAYVADIMAKENRATGMGLYRAISDVGFVSGPLLLGWLADTRGYSFPFLVNSLLLLFAVMIFQSRAKEPSRSVNVVQG
ncbi:MAG: MFS transporter [Chloroflexi bacterium]|nr:MFS transporter [Chloroflexota bacterium]